MYAWTHTLLQLLSNPVCELCRRHEISFHTYVDDTQVYMVIRLQFHGTGEVLARHQYMDESKQASIKSGKIGTSRQKNFSDHSNTFDGRIIRVSSSVKNHGVYFDKSLSMEDQVSASLRQCVYQLQNIGCTGHLIRERVRKTIERSLVSS